MLILAAELETAQPSRPMSFPGYYSQHASHCPMQPQNLSPCLPSCHNHQRSREEREATLSTLAPFPHSLRRIITAFPTELSIATSYPGSILCKPGLTKFWNFENSDLTRPIQKEGSEGWEVR
eukprot:3244042-Rhodomonas_salina.2